MKILVAVDGSAISTRAVSFVVKLAKGLAQPPAITLVAVDLPLFPGAQRKLGEQAVAKYHADNGERMLGPARKVLAKAGLAHTEKFEVGEVADTLLAVAKKGRQDLVVMGSHGRGAVKGMFLGSVSAKVVAQSTLPVTIVR